MDLRVTLCRFGVSNDAEHHDWNIDQMAIDSIGDRMKWFDHNYPRIPIMRRSGYDAAPDQIVYEYYVDFPDMESLIHYTLTHGCEETTK